MDNSHFIKFIKDCLYFFVVTDPDEVASGNATVTGLFANTGYSFRIMAVNKFGTGVASVSSGKFVL